MKAMEKDRTRRYQTANGLAADVLRYLHDEPVQACPPSTAYRLTKFARKNRALLRAAAIFVAFLAVAATVSTWQAFRATQAESKAIQEQARALKERDRAERSFHMARDAVDQLLMQVSQSPKMMAQPMEKFRKELLLSAKGFYEQFVNEKFNTPEVFHDLGLAWLRLADIDQELGEYASAEASGQKAVSILEELVQAQPGVKEYERDLANAYSSLGKFYYVRRNMAKSLQAYQKAQAIQEKQAIIEPDDGTNLLALAKTYSEEGLVHNNSKRHDLAAKVAKQAQDILNKRVPEGLKAEHQSILGATQVTLGQVYHTLGATQDEVAALKAAVNIYDKMVASQPEPSAENRQLLARSRALLGVCYLDLKRIREAQDVQQAALKGFQNLAAEHPGVPVFVYDVGRCQWALARTADHSGRSEEAIDYYDKSIQKMLEAWKQGYLRAETQIIDARIDRDCVVAKAGQYEKATQDVEDIAGPGSLESVNLYNIACFYSRTLLVLEGDAKLSTAEKGKLKARYAERAMDFLHQAVAKGWSIARKIKEDPDLESLKGLSDFQKLIAELEAKEKE
jgi:tetratricopeptide (TPR) repeat protein